MINKSNIRDISFVNSIFRINKRGQSGASVITMYRILVIIIISVVVLGVSSVVYSHHINVRDSEARILVREILDCVISDAVVDLDELKGEEDIFEYCGYGKDEMRNFFVSVLVEIDGKEDFKIEGGDSSLLWIRDIFSGGADTSEIARYEVGNFIGEYNILVLDGGVEKDGKLIVEGVVNVEE